MAEGGRVDVVERADEELGRQGVEGHEYAFGMNPDWIGPYEGEMLLDFDILQYVTEEGPFRPGHNPFRAPGITEQERQELCVMLQDKLKEIKGTITEGPHKIPPGKYRRLRYLQYSDMQVTQSLALLVFDISHYLRNKLGKEVYDIEGDRQAEYKFEKRVKGRTYNNCRCRLLLIGAGFFYTCLIIGLGCLIRETSGVILALDPPWVIPVTKMDEINFQCHGNYEECPVLESVATWKTDFQWNYSRPFNETIGLEQYVDQIQAKALQDLLGSCQKLSKNKLGVLQWRCFYDRGMKQLLGLQKIRICPIGGYMLVRKIDGNNYTLSMCTEEIDIKILNMTLSQEKYEHYPFNDIVWMGNRYFNMTTANITQQQVNISIKCDIIVPTVVKVKKEFAGYNNDFLGPWGGLKYRSILIRYKDWANVTDPPLDLNCTGLPGIAFNGTEANYTCAQNATITYGDICTQPELYVPCYSPNYSMPVMVQCKLHQEYHPNDTYRNSSNDMQVMRCRIMKEVELRFGDEFISLNFTLLRDPFLAHLRGAINFTCNLTGQFWAYKFNNATWGYEGNGSAWNESLNWLVPYRNYTKEMYVWGAYSAINYNHILLKDYKLVKKPLYTPLKYLPPRKKRGLGLTLALVTATTAGLIGTTTGTSALAVSLKLKEVMLQQSQINEATLGMLKILQRRLKQAERVILTLHQRVSRIERYLEIQYQLRGMCPFKDICEIPGNGNFTNYNDSWAIGRWAEQAEEDWQQFEQLLNNATRTNENLKNDLEKLSIDSWLSWNPLGNVFQMLITLIIIIGMGVILKGCILNCCKILMASMGYKRVAEEMVILPDSELDSESEIELNVTEKEKKPMVNSGKEESDEEF
uniref:Envelope glycoprotein n=1 Tax=Feline immunodeficiency virus TaxID=11673 RepID=Q64F58_9RETR|nr:envelope glycoprotein [Feline immunodeficiency virus]